MRVIEMTRNTIMRVLLTTSFALLPFATVTAQQTDQPEASEWNIRWQAKTEVERDDNVFHLSPDQMLKMESVDSMENLSERYKNMRSIEDVIIPVALEFGASKENGMFNLPLSIQVGIEYQSYTKNPKRSHVILDLVFQQKVSSEGRVRFQSQYVPTLFWKNYLADARDSTGRVSAGERVYKPGTYREWDVSLDYKHHFHGLLRWVDGSFLIGYRSRTYDDPFPGRNQSAMRLGPSLEFDFAKWWTAEVGFVYEYGRSPITAEVMILDEPDYLLDFNHDLDVADLNRRTVQNVDRSRDAGLINAATTFKPIKGLSISAKYEHLRRQYLSQEQIDPGNRDRVDKRDGVKITIDYNVVLGLYLRVGYRYEKQMTETPADPEVLGETADYLVRGFVIGAKWRF